MKRSHILLIIIFLISGSCRKTADEPLDPSPYWGFASASKNGLPWLGKGWALPNRNITKPLLDIFVDSLNKYEMALEGCSFVKVPSEPGTYPLVNTDINVDDGLVGASYAFMDYDVIMAYYLVAESDSSSFLTVTSYDSLSGEVRGSFEATFAVYGRHDKSYPDTIRLRNGQFHTRIIPK